MLLQPQVFEQSLFLFMSSTPPVSSCFLTISLLGDRAIIIPLLTCSCMSNEAERSTAAAAEGDSVPAGLPRLVLRLPTRVEEAEPITEILKRRERLSSISLLKRLAFLALALFQASLGNQGSWATRNLFVEGIRLNRFSDTSLLKHFQFPTPTGKHSSFM